MQKSIILLVIPQLFIRPPASINSGIQVNTIIFAPLNNRIESIFKKLGLKAKYTIDANPIENAIGIPRNIKTTKIENEI